MLLILGNLENNTRYFLYYFSKTVFMNTINTY